MADSNGDTWPVCPGCGKRHVPDEIMVRVATGERLLDIAHERVEVELSIRQWITVVLALKALDALDEGNKLTAQIGEIRNVIADAVKGGEADG